MTSSAGGQSSSQGGAAGSGGTSSIGGSGGTPGSGGTSSTGGSAGSGAGGSASGPMVACLGAAWSVEQTSDAALMPTATVAGGKLSLGAAGKSTQCKSPPCEAIKVIQHGIKGDFTASISFEAFMASGDTRASLLLQGGVKYTDTAIAEIVNIGGVMNVSVSVGGSQKAGLAVEPKGTLSITRKGDSITVTAVSAAKTITLTGSVPANDLAIGFDGAGSVSFSDLMVTGTPTPDAFSCP